MNSLYEIKSSAHAVVVPGYLGAGCTKGERSAAFSGGRSVTPLDIDMDVIGLLLPVVYSRLEAPPPQLTFERQIVDIGMDSPWRCSSCDYEGRSVAKWGGIPDSQDLIIFDPGIMEYVTSDTKWKRYIKYAHCLNCWKVISDEQKVPVPKVHRTTVIRKAVDRLQTLDGTQVNNLRIALIGLAKRLAKRKTGSKAKKTVKKKRRLQLNTRSLAHASESIIEKLGKLDLPTTRQKLKQYREELELRSNMPSNSDPTVRYADTSALQSLLLQCSGDTTATQIRQFQRWLDIELQIPSTSLVGYQLLFAALHLASTTERTVELRTVYSELKFFKQKNMTLGECKRAYDDVLTELEVVTRKKPDAELTANFFVASMAEGVRQKFHDRYSTQFPGTEYTWKNILQLTEAMRDLSANNYDGGQHKIKKAVRTLAAHQDQLAAQYDGSGGSQSESHNDRNRRGQGSSLSNTQRGELICTKCGNKHQKAHPWYRCLGIGGRCAERPTGSGQYKMVDLRILDTPEGRKIQADGGLENAYCNKEGATGQYFQRDGFHETDRAKKHREVDQAILKGGGKGRFPKASTSSGSKLSKPQIAALCSLGHKRNGGDGDHDDEVEPPQKKQKTSGAGGDCVSRVNALFSAMSDNAMMTSISGADAKRDALEVLESRSEFEQELMVIQPAVQANLVAQFAEEVESQRTSILEEWAPVLEGFPILMDRLARATVDLEQARINNLFGSSVTTETPPVDSNFALPTSTDLQDLELPCTIHECMLCMHDEDDQSLFASQTGDAGHPKQVNEPRVGTTGGAHRSIEALFELQEGNDKGNYLAVDETNDTAAGLDYIVLELAEAIMERCPDCIVDKKQYVDSKKTVSADGGEMSRVGYLKLRFIIRNLNNEDVVTTRRFEVLTKCILQMIHGIASQSEEQGHMNIHAQMSSATMVQETYEIRFPKRQLYPLRRQTNHLRLSF